MPDEPDDSNVIPGDGPGADYVKPQGIAVLAAFLLVLTLAIIWQLQVRWPNCDPNGQASSANAGSTNAPSTGASRPVTPAASSVGSAGSTGPSGAAAATSGTAGAAGTAAKATPLAPTQEAAGVKVTSVAPRSGDVAGSTPVQISGDGFLDNPTVTFGGSPATAVQWKSASLIAAKTPAHSEGDADVVVTNSDKTTGKLTAGYTYTSSCTGLCRSQLLVLVLLAGALGACFHAMRSLWTFVGNRSFRKSWILMYVCLPLNGAALAFIFFILISAGSGFFSEPKGSNTCFWIIGIAALVGVASQQAAENLKKIADAVFTTVPKKADSLQAATISVASVDPPQGPLAGLAGVKITGSGFTKQSVVAFGPAAGTNLQFVSPSSLVVDAPPATKTGPVDVTVTDTGSKATAVKPNGFTYQ